MAEIVSPLELFSTHEITTWSGKEMQARQVYHCRHCGGVITVGQRYIRSVVRIGSGKNGNRYNVQEHIDCQAPWHQVANSNLLYSLGRVRATAPLTTTSNTKLYSLAKPTVQTNISGLGTISIVLEDTMAQRLMSAKSIEVMHSSIAEIEQILKIFGQALNSAVSKRKRAMMLSNLLNAIAELQSPPKTK